MHLARITASVLGAVSLFLSLAAAAGGAFTMPLGVDDRDMEAAQGQGRRQGDEWKNWGGRNSGTSVFTPNSSTTQGQQKPIAPNPQQLAEMFEQDRRAILAALVVHGGERCSSVTQSFYQSMNENGNTFWNVTCVDGGEYAVDIFNNATKLWLVLRCDALRAFNGSTCFRKLKI